MSIVAAVPREDVTRLGFAVVIVFLLCFSDPTSVERKLSHFSSLNYSSEASAGISSSAQGCSSRSSLPAVAIRAISRPLRDALPCPPSQLRCLEPALPAGFPAWLGRGLPAPGKPSTRLLA